MRLEAEAAGRSRRLSVSDGRWRLSFIRIWYMLFPMHCIVRASSEAARRVAGGLVSEMTGMGWVSE